MRAAAAGSFIENPPDQMPHHLVVKISDSIVAGKTPS